MSQDPIRRLEQIVAAIHMTLQSIPMPFSDATILNEALDALKALSTQIKEDQARAKTESNARLMILHDVLKHWPDPEAVDSLTMPGRPALSKDEALKQAVSLLNKFHREGGHQ